LYSGVDQCAPGWERNPFRKTCVNVFGQVNRAMAKQNCDKIGGALAILNSDGSLDWFMEVRLKYTGLLLNMEN